jgi:exodeoxyribonuclease V alpha subunit
MAETVAYREIDQHFADFLCNLAGVENNELNRAARAVISALGKGHICVKLADIDEPGDVGQLANILRTTKVVGSPGQFTPLILDESDRLYLYRYWKYEQELANMLRDRAAGRPDVDIPMLRHGIDRIFGEREGRDIDWQRVAAAAAVRSRFSVVSGGPGTGKTTTVVKIIALLVEQAKEERLRVALAAPTGKAAARLKESIRGAKGGLGLATEIIDLIPDDVSTLHRLLGVIPGSCRFRFNRTNQLPFDVVVVDEASMVALPLMAKLVDALLPKARLILLGDRDQLASVEAGAVLGDICDTGKAHSFSSGFCRYVCEVTGDSLDPGGEEGNGSVLADSLVILEKNYRFGSGSGISAVSRAVNAGDSAEALRLLSDGACTDITMKSFPSINAMERSLEVVILDGYREYLAEEDPEAALAAFDRFRVLCALREGRYGVDGLNNSIEHLLAAKGLIAPDHRWYRGRPVMVTVNDYTLRLFNGDIGITLPDPEKLGNLAVFFPSTEGGIRKISPFRLPEHKTVYAITVHKSQGSEFDSILLILPPFDNAVLTRELLYTGITRARSMVEIWGEEMIFAGAVSRRIDRESGLNDALWSEGSGDYLLE